MALEFKKLFLFHFYLYFPPFFFFWVHFVLLVFVLHEELFFACWYITFPEAG